MLAHAGEALGSRPAFDALIPYEQDCVIKFPETLRVLPPGSRGLVVSEEVSQ